MPNGHGKELLEKIDALKVQFQDIVKSKHSWLQKVYELTKLVVSVVEEVSSDAESAAKLTGAEKKEMALNLIDDIYFQKWQAKLVPDWIEKRALRFVAGKAIDKAVAWFNASGLFTHSA